MKRAGLLMAAGLLLFTSLPLFAQSSTGSSANATENTYPKSAYYREVPIVKIWMHELGYIVQFWSSLGKMENVYIPNTWFNRGVDSKAQIIYGQDPSYPYMDVFWVDGKFDHVVLFVDNNTSSRTWGILTAVTDLSKNFDVQEIPRVF